MPINGKMGFAAIVSAAVLLGASFDAPAAAERFRENFENGLEMDRVWALRQLQRGEIAVRPDPLRPGNRVVAMRAGGKGWRVGKAGLIHRFEPISAGSTVIMRASFLIPDGAYRDSVILMDLECASCGIDTNPGVRLYLRDGRLRVDRSKIGLRDAFYPNDPHRVQFNKWHEVEWRVTLGKGNAGRAIVRLDDAVVLDSRGTTILSQEVVSRLADVRVDEAVDRFQIGITANSNGRPTRLLVDEISFAVE